MPKTEIQILWDAFNEIDPKDQVELLKQYSYYVAEFPETHDKGCYPVCFLEWWQHDYKGEVK